MVKSVKEFYTGYVEKEWKRLIKDPYHTIEFNTTLHFLKKYLPKKGLILDAGGGPGRYTIELAKQGYDLVLLDITPANLELAKKQIKKSKLQNKVKEVIAGSISNLSRFPDNNFDAVICLGGPLSHLINKKERDKAMLELIRVAKKGAPIFVSVMSRLCLLASALRFFPNEIDHPRFKKYRDSGKYLGNFGFTATHFFLPEEFRRDFERKDFDVMNMVGLEGIGSNLKKETNELFKNKSRWKVWMETHYKTCTHPVAVGISEHMMIIGRKK